MRISSSSSIAACISPLGEVQLGELEAGVEVALVGGDARPPACRAGAPSAPLRARRSSGRRRPGAASSTGLFGHRIEGGARLGDAAGAEQRAQVVVARRVVGRIGGQRGLQAGRSRSRCRPRRAAPRRPATSSSAACSSALGTCLSRNFRTSASGSAPTKPSTGWPPLKSTQNGMLRTPNICESCCAISGSSSALSLTSLKRPA